MLKVTTKILKPLCSLALILSLPLLVLMIFGWFLIPFTYSYLKEVIAFLLLTFISTGVIILLPGKHIKRMAFALMLCILSVLCFIKLSFYFNYGVKISASALFVIFETNATEAYDFLAYYFNIKVLFILGVLCVLTYVGFMLSRRLAFKGYNTPLFLKLLSVFGIIGSVVLIQNKFFNENLFITSYKSYTDYRMTKANLKEALAQKKTSNLQQVSASDDAQTYVVVLGESASRWHMQLYGYDRNTNPLLTQIKDELLIFNDVITSNVHTIVALDKILTLSDFNNPNRENNASVIQLANMAGFKTYWLSNQKPVGIHESIPTIIGSAADQQYFLAADDYNYELHDEILLPTLNTVLNHKEKKKLIFLHLIGSHVSYKRRYPKQFKYFKESKTNAKFKHKAAIASINEYDNSMRYNDFILNEIIDLVNRQNTNSYVLYLADHGDEVYDTIDFVGHNEYRATKPMYEVPFFCWFSEAYKLRHPEIFDVNNTNKPYILEDFIHSFAELSGISFEGHDLKKSIFNSQFEKKNRYIKRGQNYDQN